MIPRDLHRVHRFQKSLHRQIKFANIDQEPYKQKYFSFHSLVIYYISKMHSHMFLYFSHRMNFG